MFQQQGRKEHEYAWFVLFPSITLKHLELQSTHSKPSLPIIPFGVFAFCQSRSSGLFPEKAKRTRLAFCRTWLYTIDHVLSKN